MDTGFFPGVKSGRGVTLTPHPLQVLWSRKCRATHLLPLWAVQPVQSFSAYTRVTFIFYLTKRTQTFNTVNSPPKIALFYNPLGQ